MQVNKAQSAKKNEPIWELKCLNQPSSEAAYNIVAIFGKSVVNVTSMYANVFVIIHECFGCYEVRFLKGLP